MIGPFEVTGCTHSTCNLFPKAIFRTSMQNMALAAHINTYGGVNKGIGFRQLSLKIGYTYVGR